jgi:hypothetical protein
LQLCILPKRRVKALVYQGVIASPGETPAFDAGAELIALPICNTAAFRNSATWCAFSAISSCTDLPGFQLPEASSRDAMVYTHFWWYFGGLLVVLS